MSRTAEYPQVHLFQSVDNSSPARWQSSAGAISFWCSELSACDHCK